MDHLGAYIGIFGSQLEDCLGKIRRCIFIRGDVPLGADFEVSKAHQTRPSLLAFCDCRKYIKYLLLKDISYCSAPCLPACCPVPHHDDHGLTL